MKFLFLIFVFNSPTLEVPKEISGTQDSFISITAKTNGKVVKWFSPDLGLNIFPVNLLKDSKTLICTSSVPGIYKVYAYTSDESGPSDPHLIQVKIVENNKNKIYKSEIKRNSEFVSVDYEIKNAAQNADKDSVNWLAQFYEEMSKAAMNADFETAADLFRSGQVTIAKRFYSNELSHLRELIAKKTSAKLPDNLEKKLDEVTRISMKNIFLEVSNILKGAIK